MISSLTAILPLIARELLVEARRPLTYWIRAAPLAAMMLILAGKAMERSGLGPGSGPGLFGAIHICMVLGTWLLVPLMAAESLNREVREGTLGLLLLTPLTPAGIVIGKSLLYTLRAGMLLLSCMPVLGVCFLLGGVTATQLGISLVLNASMLCLALAAGLLASVYNDRWTSALVWAYVTLAALVLLYIFIHIYLAHMQVRPVYVDNPAILFRYVWFALLKLILDADTWTRVLAITPSTRWIFLELAVLSFLVLAYAIHKTAARVRILGAGPTQHPQLERIARAAYTPMLFKHEVRSLMRRLLEINPVAWLHQRLPQARAFKWVLCFLAVGWFSSNIKFRNGHAFDLDIIWASFAVMGVLLALASSSSFRGESESGALELLLVTPLTEGRILKGRLFGIYWLFLPAFLATMAMVHYGEATFARKNWQLIHFLFWIPIGTYLAVPLFGMAASLRVRGLVGAWVGTGMFGAFCVMTQAGLLLGMIMAFVGERGMDIWDPPPIALININLSMLLCNVMIVRILWWRLSTGLNRRSFTPAFA